MIKNKKGFTLIELLVVLGLSAAIVSLVMKFFMVNINNYETISNDTELQFQSQYILNFMSNKIMESSKIEGIKENAVIHIDHIGEQKITKVSFRYGTFFMECYNFEFRNSKIMYGKNAPEESANTELGVYIKEIRMEPVPETSTFKNAKAVKIKIVLLKGNELYEACQTANMRN